MLAQCAQSKATPASLLRVIHELAPWGFAAIVPPELNAVSAEEERTVAAGSCVPPTEWHHALLAVADGLLLTSRSGTIAGLLKWRLRVAEVEI